jgi:Na+/H+-dicarboxylate symporter
MHVCISVIFIAQVYQLDLSWSAQCIVILLALLMSFGMAGIPSASLIAIVVILGVLGMPVEGVGLLIALDRIIDMFRTTVNVFTNSCSAVLVARSEGELTHLIKEQHEKVASGNPLV